MLAACTKLEPQELEHLDYRTCSEDLGLDFTVENTPTYPTPDL